MAFSKTSSSSKADMLSQILAFAIANAGFADQGNVPTGTSPNIYTMYRLSKGGVYYNFRVVDTYIQFRMSTTLLSTWPDATNSARYDSMMSTQTYPGPYPNLYLYTDGVVVGVCVELTNQIFNHMAFGKITITDTLDGGEFMTGGYYAYSPYGLFAPNNGNKPPFFYGATSGFSPCDFMLTRQASPTGDYRDYSGFGYQDEGRMVNGNVSTGINQVMLLRTPNMATQRNILFNNYMLRWNPENSLYQVIGHVPNIRGLSVQNLDPAEIIYTDWQCFPLAQMNGDGVNAVNSQFYGIAYKRA